MKNKLRGLKRNAIAIDFNLYRLDVPIRDVANAQLSVIDLWPETIERTIMFVHGYAGCAETWEHQINHFAKNFRVVAPDLRGHGQSDAPYTQYTMDELVSDLHTIVEVLDLPEKFILVGHSFGGSICVEYANKYPETLEKLVLIATAGEYPLPRAANWAYRLPTRFYRLWWDYRPKWNAEVHVMKRMMFNNLRKWKGWPLLRNITTDTLVITGQRDNYFPRHVFDEAAKMIPNAETYDVGSAKHKVQLERAQAVNRAVERFVSPGSRRNSWRNTHSTDPLAKRPWTQHYSPGTPPTVPIPRQPLDKFLESAADWVPKRTATIFYGKKLTYKELNANVNQFANVLYDFGVRPGGRILIVLPNSPQFIVTFYAVLRVGGVVVLPNPDADAAAIIHYANETNADIVVLLHSFADLGKAIRTQTTVKHVIFTDINDGMVSSSSKQMQGGRPTATEIHDFDHDMESLTDNASTHPPSVQVSSKQLAVIIYTSGTTDNPKGVCLSHANLVANALQTRHWVPDLEYGKEVFLSVLPLSHSYGMTGGLNVPIAIGATIILLPKFELQQVLNAIKEHRPTIFPAVPAMYTRINHASNVRSYGLSSIKACISGAAPLPVEVQESFEKLTHGRLVEGYGLTECAPITHANPLYGRRKVGSIGIPLPNTDAKVVDLTTDEDLGAGHLGELVVRGPQTMLGYWEPELNGYASSNHIKDGWLYTGDIAVMDDDGYFKIVSRKRDTIMTGMYSVYPRDVEEVLYEHSKVLEVAVVGVGTEDGQAVKAFVVPRPNITLAKEELIALCQRRLEEYEVPWEIEFRTELPKSFVGKILRRMLTEES